MTKEEVEKRELLIKEESKLLKDYQKIAKSDTLVQDKLIEELNFVDEELTKIMTDKEKEKKQKVQISAKGLKKKKAIR
jgi:DNA gyrase subunit A